MSAVNSSNELKCMMTLFFFFFPLAASEPFFNPNNWLGRLVHFNYPRSLWVCAREPAGCPAVRQRSCTLWCSFHQSWPQNWYFTNFHIFSKAAFFKMWIKTLMGTHDVQRLHPLLVGTRLLSNHSCCFLAQCRDTQEQQQHLQDKRVNEKDGQMIKFQKNIGGRGGKKRSRDSEAGTFDRAEADFLF